MESLCLAILLVFHFQEIYKSKSGNLGRWLGRRFLNLDSGGGQIASLALSDDNPVGTLSKTMNSADYVYVKIKGKDSWCNDAIDYTLTAP